MKMDELFTSFTKQKIAIVGDVMLDTYWWGHVERISPEAPVPVVTLDKKELRLGGAANVALNTVALGADTTIFTVIGNDEDGETLTQLLKQRDINTTHLVKSNHRITTNKTRVISRNQQMMRLDSEMSNDINTEEQEQLLDVFSKYVEREKPSVVIFEDYNKGVLAADLIAALLDVCNQAGIVSTVDPKRKNFFSYKGVTMFKPNLKEVKEGLNLLVDEVSESLLQNVHQELHKLLHHSISLITLSEHGMFYQQDEHAAIIPTHVRNIADVSGAGDTVIAVASLVYAASKDVHLAASVSNIAGGLVCEEVGTVAIKKERLMHECQLLLS